mmetsp:Transcript_14268/g.19670  ORF Transcript_14268/g.19670 Transcript_14268/m.19670 type:complete len:290 (+) Transcript_14268:247-1116(+)
MAIPGANSSRVLPSYVPDNEVLDFFGHNHPRYSHRVYSSSTPAMSLEQFSTVLKKKQAAEISVGVRVEAHKTREVERINREQVEKEHMEVLEKIKESERVKSRERKKEREEEKERQLEAEAEQARIILESIEDTKLDVNNVIPESCNPITISHDILNESENIGESETLCKIEELDFSSMEVDERNKKEIKTDEEMEIVEVADPEKLEDEDTRKFQELQEKLDRLAAHKHELMVNLKRVLSTEADTNSSLDNMVAEDENVVGEDSNLEGVHIGVSSPTITGQLTSPIMQK